jgi:hypothetical protein
LSLPGWRRKSRNWPASSRHIIRRAERRVGRDQRISQLGSDREQPQDIGRERGCAEAIVWPFGAGLAIACRRAPPAGFRSRSAPPALEPFNKRRDVRAASARGYGTIMWMFCWDNILPRHGSEKASTAMHKTLAACLSIDA